MIESGLFENLRKSGVDLKNYLSVTSLSIYKDDDTFTQWNLIDGNKDKFYHSKNGIGQWVYFNFYAKPLKIKGFYISPNTNRDPLHWKIEGTNNGIDFKTVYYNDGVPMCELDTNNYCIEKKRNTFILNHSVTYSGYRFITTGQCSRPGDEWLVLSEIDFIGNFNYLLKTCLCRRNNNVISIHYLLLIIS